MVSITGWVSNKTQFKNLGDLDWSTQKPLWLQNHLSNWGNVKTLLREKGFREPLVLIGYFYVTYTGANKLGKVKAGSSVSGGWGSWTTCAQFWASWGNVKSPERPHHKNKKQEETPSNDTFKGEAKLGADDLLLQHHGVEWQGTAAWQWAGLLQRSWLMTHCSHHFSLFKSSSVQCTACEATWAILGATHHNNHTHHTQFYLHSFSYLLSKIKTTSSGSHKTKHEAKHCYLLRLSHKHDGSQKTWGRLFSWLLLLLSK